MLITLPGDIMGRLPLCFSCYFPRWGIIIREETSRIEKRPGEILLSFLVFAGGYSSFYFFKLSLGAPHLGHALGRHRPSLVSPQAVHLHTATSRTSASKKVTPELCPIHNFPA